MYAALDVLVVPSRKQEELGNVNIEAMASGVPIIATRVGGLSEIVVDGVTGFVVDRASPSAIASRLEFLLRNAEVRTAMGIAARQRAAKMFAIRQNAALIEEILLG